MLEYEVWDSLKGFTLTISRSPEVRRCFVNKLLNLFVNFKSDIICLFIDIDVFVANS